MKLKCKHKWEICSNNMIERFAKCSKCAEVKMVKSVLK